MQEIPCKVFAHTKIDQVFFVIHPNKRMSIILRLTQKSQAKLDIQSGLFLFDE